MAHAFNPSMQEAEPCRSLSSNLSTEQVSGQLNLSSEGARKQKAANNVTEQWNYVLAQASSRTQLLWLCGSLFKDKQLKS